MKGGCYRILFEFYYGTSSLLHVDFKSNIINFKGLSLKQIKQSFWKERVRLQGFLMVNLNKSTVNCRYTAGSHLLNKSLTETCDFWCSDLSYLAGKALLKLIHKTAGTLLLKLLLNISVMDTRKNHSKKTISHITPFK